MVTLITDALFTSRRAFVNYMLENDNKELRERLLVCDKLRYWYCLHIENRQEVWEKITTPLYALLYHRHIQPLRCMAERITCVSLAIAEYHHIQASPGWLGNEEGSSPLPIATDAKAGVNVLGYVQEVHTDTLP